jgi:hypothetical protein
MAKSTLGVAVVVAMTAGWLATAAAQPAGSGAAPVRPPLELGAPQVAAAASPTALSLGTTFSLFVTASYNDGVEVNLREPTELGAAFEVRRRSVKDSVRADGAHVREWQLEVIAWELGDLVVPPIAVTFTFGGHVGQVQTNTVPIHVDGMLGDVIDDPKLMRGLEPPRALTQRDWFWVYVAAAAGAAVGGVTALVWSQRRRRRHVELLGDSGIRMRDLDTPSARALARLAAIERSGVLSRDADRKHGYDQMVDVIRDYLGARYRVVTRDLTSAELSRKLATATSDDERACIDAWFGRCDVVRYGGLRPDAAAARRTLDDARGVVATTTPHAVAAEGEAA